MNDNDNNGSNTSDPTRPQNPQAPLGNDFITTPSAGAAKSDDEKMKGMLSHLGVFVPILVPFLILQANGKESPFIRAHATEALNFQITMMIPMLVAIILSATLIGACIGVPIALVVGVGALIFSIIGALKAKDGEAYRYPFSMRFMK